MTPSKARRRGREDYDGSTNPIELCPFKNEHDRANWLEGWKEAERAELLECEKMRSVNDDLRSTLLSEVETVGELIDIINRITNAL
jgi:ribosome modulation factor